MIYRRDEDILIDIFLVTISEFEKDSFWRTIFKKSSTFDIEKIHSIHIR